MAEILTSYLTEIASRTFAYGTDDCASFVVEWFDRMTGINALPKWQGRYTDKASCETYITTNGGFIEIATGFFNGNYDFFRAEPAPGNAVFASFKGIEAMGLRLSSSQIAMRTERGLMITSRAKVLAEWGPA